MNPVVSNPKIKNGEPVIAGTRVPILGVIAKMARGMSFEDVLKNHPTITREKLEAALLWLGEQALRVPKAPKSRPARWTEACSAAHTALTELEDLRGDYEDWRDGLPENLQSSTLAEKLEEVVNLDIQSAIAVVEDAEGLDLPKGFGRD